ncbi:MAG: VOC family protein [Candidatus Lokiarchaeota archaeon]|nr:VOC family protein [Candidatus Lokiarchaeota archaeon]
MKIEHIAIWTNNLEILKDFYKKYFNIEVGRKYRNEKTKFESYFLSFNGECRLEIMQIPSIQNSKNNILKQYVGLNHFAIAVGSKSKVISITQILHNDGYNIISEPRKTGDGYFESVILDPDGNRVEIIL